MIATALWLVVEPGCRPRASSRLDAAAATPVAPVERTPNEPSNPRGPVTRFFIRMSEGGQAIRPRDDYSESLLHVDMSPSGSAQSTATLHFSVRFYLGTRLYVVEGASMSVVGERHGRLLRCAVGYHAGISATILDSERYSVDIERLTDSEILISFRQVRLCPRRGDVCVEIELFRLHSTGHHGLLRVPREFSSELESSE